MSCERPTDCRASNNFDEVSPAHVTTPLRFRTTPVFKGYQIRTTAVRAVAQDRCPLWVAAPKIFSYPQHRRPITPSIGGWSQPVAATLYPDRERWSVWRCDKDTFGGSLRQRRLSFGIAGRGARR